MGRTLPKAAVLLEISATVIFLGFVAAHEATHGDQSAAHEPLGATIKFGIATARLTEAESGSNLIA
jgi:hypothetical protein